ncbi:MAG: putative beta-lysine N-acetyltransferase [Candidatus Omnitrophica bacterium]|nr:putative beta-lysine N-acetyltransferase [Candidatus Omnitrophota bacterium]
MEQVRGSVIQHGDSSRRIYLMSLDKSGLPELVGDLDELAAKNGYTKIFAKVPVSAAGDFLESGYDEEARIEGLFRGEEDGVFLGKFLAEERKMDEKSDMMEQVVRKALARKGAPVKGEDLPSPVRAEGGDLEDLSRLYGRVFDSYPFPIFEPEYLEKTMESHIDYYIIRFKGAIIGASSAEKYPEKLNAEMTDFATLPEYRGRGIAGTLLSKMEEDIREEGFRTAYTIARAYSWGMNITFGKAGYQYGGTLIKNTNIAGSIESMNVWYRSLRA